MCIRDSGLPDWLREEQVDLDLPETATEENVTPNWLTDMSDETTSDIDSDAESEAVPDWLQEDTEQVDTVSSEEEDVPNWLEDVSEEPELEAVAEGTAGETQTDLATETSPADQNVLDKLSVAKGTIEAGELDEALSVYQDLIRETQGLDEVIETLTENLPNFDDQPTIYETLGDAHMRQGDLPQALEAYQQALSKL